jgi:arginine decarboxylase
MLASTLGIEFDSDAAWNERKHVYETSSLIIESKSITAFAQGDRTGLWTCAVAAAVR